MKGTLFRILSNTWLIDGGVANSFFFQLNQYVSNGIAIEFQPQSKDGFEATQRFVARSQSSAPASTSQQYVGIVNIKGALMKDDQACGPYGMNTISNTIKALKADRQCIGAVGVVDSPGGTVDGTSNLGRTIAEFGKPFIMHVDGMAASAAYWIASQGDKVYLNDKLDCVGSVGVMFSTVDIQPALEKQGVKFHNIVADESPEKNLAFFNLLKKGDDSLLKVKMSEIYSEFKSAILSKRNIADEYLKGSVYTATEAIASGMADGIKSLDECIAEVVDMYEVQSQDSQPTTTAQNKVQNQIQSMNKQYVNLNSILGVDSLESLDGSVSLNEEQLASIETALEAKVTAESTVATLTSQGEEKDSTIATLTSQATKNANTIAALKGKGAAPIISSGNTTEGSKSESVQEREVRLTALAETDFNAYLNEIKES